MKFSPRIESYERLPGETFQNHWCTVTYFTEKAKRDDQRENLQLVDKCCYLTSCKVSKSRNLPNSFYSNFPILWCNFCLATYIFRKFFFPCTFQIQRRFASNMMVLRDYQATRTCCPSLIISLWLNSVFPCVVHWYQWLPIGFDWK